MAVTPWRKRGEMTRLVPTNASDQRANLAKRTGTRRPVSATETYLAGKREGASRDTMLACLKKLAGILGPMMTPGAEKGGDVAEGGETGPDVFSFPWHELDLALASGLRSHLQSTCALASANLYLSALRGVLKISAGLGLISFEEREQVLMGLVQIKGHTEEAGRALPQDEMAKLFADCDVSTEMGKRDALILILLFGCGLRCEEAQVLDVEHIRREKDSASLLIHGKGGKERRVFLVGNALAYLDDWLKHRGRDKGPLLLTRGQHSHRMSLRAIYDRVVLRAKRAGLEHVAPHDLRRSFVTSMLDAGHDLKLVSELVGHAQLQTTARYDRRPEKRRREVHEKFLNEQFPPIQRKKKR